MLGMKRDCGGAAGILGAFRAAVKQVSLKSVTLSKPPFLLCNSSFQVKCLLVAMWRWEHNAFVGLNSMTVIVFYFKSTRGLLYMHSPKNKNKTRKTIVLTYYYTGTSNVDVFSRPPPPRTPPPPPKKKQKQAFSIVCSGRWHLHDQTWWPNYSIQSALRAVSMYGKGIFWNSVLCVLTVSPLLFPVRVLVRIFMLCSVWLKMRLVLVLQDLMTY